MQAFEAIVDSGMSVPEFEGRPSLSGFEWLWEAFSALSTCRSIGFSVGPIPWTAIEQYARAEKLSEEERWVLHEVIRHMDSIFTEYHSKADGKAH